jgi:hypothetical protein
MSRGRPTDYDPSLCEALVETMSRGDTLACFAAEQNVSRDTCYQWMKTHPEFSDAFKRAQENSQRFWERMLARCAMGAPIKIGDKEYKNYNITAMIFLMKSRFADYKEQLFVHNQEMNYSDPTGLTAET